MGYAPSMTRCGSEDRYPVEGFGWTAPNPLSCELETERLIVRAYRLGDVEDLFNAISESREGHLLPWMVWCKENHRTIESTTKYVCDQVLAMENPMTFNNVGVGIFEKGSGTLVGGTGVHDIRKETSSCETGYWLRKSAVGNGYALEACARVLSWALAPQGDGGLGLQRVRLYCSAENTRSAKLIGKLGITQEVRQRRDFFVEGLGATDRLGWGVLAEEWDCENHCAIAAG